MADTRDLKSLAKYLACGFESRLRHQCVNLRFGFYGTTCSEPNANGDWGYCIGSTEDAIGDRGFAVGMSGVNCAGGRSRTTAATRKTTCGPQTFPLAPLRRRQIFDKLLIDLSARKDHRDAGESPRVGGRKQFPPPSLYKETIRHGHAEHIR